MRKICAIFFSFIFVCMSGCGKVNSVPPSTKEKPYLVFQIDEGARDLELLSAYRNDLDGLEGALNRIVSSLQPLQDQYEIVYHIYPHYHYQEKGYGVSASDPNDRISRELKFAMGYFESIGAKVLLEGLSSGINKHQTGQGDSLPLVPVHYGDEEHIYGLGMDLECYEYLSEEYESFFGIRFHENLGSDEWGGVIPDGEKYRKGYEVSERAIREIINLLERQNKKLVWSDQSWNKVRTHRNSEKFVSCLQEADARLGKNLIVTYANNSWDIVKSVSMEQCLEKGIADNASVGYSVQSWFWQEADTSTIHIDGGTKWYKLAFMDMPVELMVAFTLEGIEKSARLIQFEPAQYFWNTKVVHMAGAQDYSGYYEKSPDYSSRPTLERFVRLLDQGCEFEPDPQSYYSVSESALDKNSEDEKPKKYAQATLFFIGDDGDNYCADTYNFDPAKMHIDENARFRKEVAEGDIVDITGINLTFGARDETLVVKKTSNGVIGEFYYYNSCMLPTATEIFNDNENGKVIGVTAGNFIREYVSVLDNDSDEIILSRLKDGRVNFELYKAVADMVTVDAPIWNFKYVRAEEEKRILDELQLSDSVDEESFQAVFVIKNRRAVYKDGTRTLDNLGMSLRTENGVTVKSFIRNISADISDKMQINQNISLIGEVVDVTTLDVNLDGTDEIVFLISDKDKNKIQTFKVKSNALEAEENYCFDLHRKVKLIFANFIGTYYNASQILP